jgi:serine O-acetyltransferase
MFSRLRDDLAAVARNDPAAANSLETLLCHTPLHAITLHRIAHWLHTALGLPVIPRLLSVVARFWSGVEIHPGARIGRRFFIDHGTGVVIGETAEIGDDCVLFHNVALGGTGKHRGKRHPTLCNRVYLGTGATLLGPITVGDDARIGAGSFVIMHDVPARCTAVGTPARIVRRSGEPSDEELPATQLSDRSISVPMVGDSQPATTGDTFDGQATR